MLHLHTKSEICPNNPSWAIVFTSKGVQNTYTCTHRYKQSWLQRLRFRRNQTWTDLVKCIKNGWDAYRYTSSVETFRIRSVLILSLHCVSKRASEGNYFLTFNSIPSMISTLILVYQIRRRTSQSIGVFCLWPRCFFCALCVW